MKKYSTTSRVLCKKFPSINMLLQIMFCRPATPFHGLNRAPLNLITTTLNQSTSAQPPSHHPTRRHQSGQLVYVPSPRICFKSQRSRFDTQSGHILSFLLPLIQAGQLSVSGESMYTKYWFNCLGGLSLPRKSVGKLTDRPDMTIDVYHGSKKNNITLTPDKDLPNDSQTNILIRTCSSA